MREVKSEIQIAADPKKVWEVLTDFNQWTQWNPISKEASGNAELGAKLHMIFCGTDGKGGQKFAPTVTALEPQKLFRWRGVMMAEFLFTADKVFELSAAGGGTKLVHKEIFGGVLVPLFWGKMESGCLQMIKAMNEALKAKVEEKS